MPMAMQTAEVARPQHKRGAGEATSEACCAMYGFVDEAAVFAGTAKEDGVTMMCPDLLDHVAKEVERETRIF